MNVTRVVRVETVRVSDDGKNGTGYYVEFRVDRSTGTLHKLEAGLKKIDGFSTKILSPVYVPIDILNMLRRRAYAVAFNSPRMRSRPLPRLHPKSSGQQLLLI